MRHEKSSKFFLFRHQSRHRPHSVCAHVFVFVQTGAEWEQGNEECEAARFDCKRIYIHKKNRRTQIHKKTSLQQQQLVFSQLRFVVTCYRCNKSLEPSGECRGRWIEVKLDLTCWAFLLSVVALRRFSAPSLIFSSLRISLRIFSRCSSRSCCTPESEKSEFWSKPSCSRTDSPPGSLWTDT